MVARRINITLTVVLGISAATAIVAQVKNANPPVAPMGTYQFISSPYTPITKDGRALSLSTVFRVDTRTGKTWIYTTGTDEKGAYDGWQLIGEQIR